MKKTFISSIVGGLGNQMFQYAFVRALQSQYGGDICFDLHSYSKDKQRVLSLNQYILNGCVKKMSFIDKKALYILAFLRRLFIKIYKSETSNKFSNTPDYGIISQYQIRYYTTKELKALPYYYVTGNYMSYLFFERASSVIKKDFTLKKELTGNNKSLLLQIKCCESVCVHIRLGDYLSPEWKDKLYVCDEQYYVDAIQYIKDNVNNPVFYVFTNTHKDVEWIKANYHLPVEVVFVDEGNSDVEDLELMRNCKHFIMSNSTYSWWSQFLADYNRKIVCAPKKWNNFPEWDMKDLYMNSWVIINNER